MPLQNRVTPFGDIVADASRGLFMGNRGILHGSDRRLLAPRWRHANWVTCTLSFKARQRRVMTPGSYTELFFLDEATALAAGHRPCAECRRVDYQRYRAAWATAHGDPLPPSAKDLDRALHAARLSAKKRQRTFQADMADLPDGVMIAVDDAAWLVWAGKRSRWRLKGYDPPERLLAGAALVLTPRPSVLVLGAGYRPVVHPSAAWVDRERAAAGFQPVQTVNGWR